MRIKAHKSEGGKNLDRNQLLLQLKDLAKENNGLRARNKELEEKLTEAQRLIENVTVLQDVPARLVLAHQLNDAKNEIIGLKDKIKWLEGLFKK